MAGEFRTADAYAEIRAQMSDFSQGLANARTAMQTTQERMHSLRRMQSAPPLLEAPDVPRAPQQRDEQLIGLAQKQLDENRQQKELLKAVLNLMKKEGVVVGTVGP